MILLLQKFGVWLVLQRVDMGVVYSRDKKNSKCRDDSCKSKEQDGMTLAISKPHTEVPSIPTSAACHN